MKLSAEEIQEIKEFLVYPKAIVIFTHRNPDGDAIGSSLGLRHYLERLGHTVKIVLPSEYPSTFYFLKGVDDCLVFDLEPKRCIEVLHKADLIACLDFNALDRVDKLGPEIIKAKGKKLLIDHHLDPEPFADHVFSETEASSTCELVYQFIKDLGDKDKIDPIIGEALFTGLITDTGSFKYSTRPETYQVAAALKSAGVDDYTLQDRIHNTASEKQIRLLGHCLTNRLEVIPEYGTAIIALTKQDYIDFEISRGDTEGVVNYMLMMKGIEVAAFIREQPTIVKLSLRSKGDISVQQICRNHFNGGGHKNASGGAAYAKLEDIVERFKSVLPRYLKKRVPVT